jgi:hypothetical protein
VHSYIVLSYQSDKGGIISVTVNYPISSRDVVAPTYEITEKTRQQVVIGDVPAALTILRARDVQVMAVNWRLDDTMMAATSYNFLPEVNRPLSGDEFVAFLANVR